MEHLYFTKVDKPPQDRRKKKGFVPRGDRKSNIQHGEELLSQVKNQVTENNDDIRRFRFECSRRHPDERSRLSRIL